MARKNYKRFTAFDSFHQKITEMMNEGDMPDTPEAQKKPEEKDSKRAKERNPRPTSP